MTFDTWLNAVVAAAEEREERALESLDRIVARRLAGTRVERAEYRDGRVYISETRYFDDVLQQVWECTVAKKWLVDRKYQVLSFDDVLQYLHILRSVPKSRWQPLVMEREEEA